MGAMQKRKGASGELEFSKVLLEAGFNARRGRQYCGTPDSPDVVSNVPGVHWEVKRCEAITPYKALKQATDEADEGEMPIVAHRQNNKDWIAILTMSDLLTLIKRSIKLKNVQSNEPDKDGEQKIIQTKLEA